MAKRVDFLRLPVKAWQQGDTVAAYRNGKVVRIPIFGESDAPDFPDLAAVATTGKYSDLLNKPALGTAAAKDSTAFATADQGTKADTAYGWGNHAQAGYLKSHQSLEGYAKKSELFSGEYSDLTGKPSLGSAASKDVSDFATASEGGKGAAAYSWGNHADAGYSKSDSKYSAGTGLNLTDTSFSVKYGAAAGTAAQGNDSRISDGQTAYGWGNHASAGYAVASSVNTALSAKVDKVAGKDLSANDFTDADKGKLDGVAVGATKNATDAHLLDRANHTGTQPHTTITGLGSASTRNVGEIAGNVMGVGAFGFPAGMALVGADLNEVGLGIFWQNSNNNATQERNYPVGDAGTLLSLMWGTASQGRKMQVYIAYRNQTIYVRSSGSAASFNPWVRLHSASNFNPSNYYTKAQTDALVAGATTGANVWQNATTALIKNAYNKVAFPSPKTLTLPPTPTENDYVVILVIDGDMKGSKIARNGKTIMGVAEDMTIDMKAPYLRLDYVAGSWRIAS